ncbi:hypothetical protein [Amycolatopsis sp. NPDC051372]
MSALPIEQPMPSLYATLVHSRNVVTPKPLEQLTETTRNHVAAEWVG